MNKSPFISLSSLNTLSEEEEFHRINANKHNQWFFNAVICRLGETSS